MAYNSSLCAHSISVELPLTLEMTNESIISNGHDLVIEAGHLAHNAASAVLSISIQSAGEGWVV